MSDEEDCAWIALECATRNVVTLLRLRKELPAALTWEGAGVAAGLTSEDAIHDGEELVKRA